MELVEIIQTEMPGRYRRGGGSHCRSTAARSAGRTSGPASAATASAPAVGSGRPSGVATSASRHPSEHLVDDVGAPGLGPGPRRSLKMRQMSGSVDSTLRLLDLADEGRFPLMSHVWRLDKRDESRERRGPGPHRGRPRLSVGEPSALERGMNTSLWDHPCASRPPRGDALATWRSISLTLLYSHL